MKRDELIAFRPLEPSDRNFILATWLRNLWYSGEFTSSSKSDFMMVKHDEIEVILSVACVRIACLREDPNTIIGYGVTSPKGETIYAYVKKAWRGIGIGRILLNKEHL